MLYCRVIHITLMLHVPMRGFCTIQANLCLIIIFVWNAVIRLLYTCSVLLPNGKNGLITHYTVMSKLGQMLPLSECLLRPILCICDMPEKRMRKEDLQYANGKLAICESQKKNESVFYAIRIVFSGNFMCVIFTV